MKKRFLFFVFGLLVTMTAMADGEFPKLSNGSEEYWYYIEMQRGKTVLTSFANFGNIKTAAVDANNKDKQLWKITQNSDGSYSITSRYVDGGTNWKLLYKSGTSRFRSRRNKVDADEYKDFEIVQTTYSGSENLEGFEIKVKGLNVNQDKNYLNQNGAYGANVEIGCWKPGDPNNVLKFIAEEDMLATSPDTKPANVAEVSVTGISNWQPENKHTLWYTQPGTIWMTSSLPIGNGQFGGTILGGVKRDDIQFNDKTLWRGHLNGLTTNANFGCYLNFGHLYITTSSDEAATNYRRWLDLDEGKAGVVYTSGGVDYEREYIASYPDDVIAIRYKASQNGKINTSIILFNMNGNAPTYTMDETTGVATFSGTITRTSATGTVEPESYYCQARVVASGGSVSTTSSGITVTGADEMTVYLRGMTNFSPDNDDYIYPASQLSSKVQTCLSAAVNKGYEAIKTAHIADYKNLYDRCQLTLADNQNLIPTNKLITNYKNNPDNNLILEEMYFTYGRYLLISSSRGVALPANLQGIWNNSNDPAWHSDIHSNVNVEECYWPAEITNLSELHTAFTDYIYREACERPQWRRNAINVAGQTKGWTLSTENNIYGGGSNWHTNYTIANAWYCMHMWQHYRYTLDLDFLKNKALPAMKSCCDYWLERLVLGGDGTYECPNEYSPEHGPASENATAHSQQLVWDLFNNTLLACQELENNHISTGLSNDFLSDLNEKFSKLDNGIKTEVVNGTTLLREWKYTSQNNVSTYKTHRHMSHLMGVYPGNQIDKDIDLAIYNAAKQSILERGYASTGWSIGWKINLNARIENPEGCRTIIKNALKINTSTSYNEQGGIYNNLWDAHAPFQIDGNFGTCAGMAEMLMQSHLGKIKILPALPTEWATGEIKGLRAVNKFEVDIAWKNGTADIIKIKSEAGKLAIVKYPNITSYCVVKESDGASVIYDVVSDEEIEFPTKEGETYIIRKGVPMADGGFPKLSNGSEEYWYYIQMQRGKTVLTSFANFGKIKTAAVDANNKDKQLWKVTQNDDGSYSITSRYVDGGTNWKLLYKSGDYLRFRSRKNKVDADEYKDFEIVPTTYSGSENLEGFEIKVKGLNANQDKNYLNQNGAYGANVEIGCWKPGDPNNVLKFIAEEDMLATSPDTKPVNAAELDDGMMTALDGLADDFNETTGHFTGTIYDMQGRKLSEKSVSMLKKGIYIVWSEDSHESKKIVVK